MPVTRRHRSVSVSSKAATRKGDHATYPGGASSASTLIAPVDGTSASLAPRRPRYLCFFAICRSRVQSKCIDLDAHLRSALSSWRHPAEGRHDLYRFGSPSQRCLSSSLQELLDYD